MRAEALRGDRYAGRSIPRHLVERTRRGGGGVVEAVFAAEDQKESEKIEVSPKVESDGGIGKEWEPFWEPRLFNLAKPYVSD